MDVGFGRWIWDGLPIVALGRAAVVVGEVVVLGGQVASGFVASMGDGFCYESNRHVVFQYFFLLHIGLS